MNCCKHPSKVPRLHCFFIRRGVIKMFAILFPSLRTHITYVELEAGGSLFISRQDECRSAPCNPRRWNHSDKPQGKTAVPHYSNLIYDARGVSVLINIFILSVFSL
jgi:hypothetical protein